VKLNRIKAVLKEKKITQVALAKQMGISKTAVSDLCQNRAQPSLKRLFQIAAIIDCSPQELIALSNPFD